MKDHLILVCVLVVLAIVAAPGKSTAAMISPKLPNPVLAAHPSCETSLKKVVYQASFEWKAQKMRILLGNPVQSHGKTQWIAQIVEAKKQGRCFATCQATPLENDLMQMSCQGTQFDALATPATLFLPEAIRFGSWLTGYQQSSLRVEFDQYTRPKLARR